jgi:hypothetical protein
MFLSYQELRGQVFLSDGLMVNDGDRSYASQYQVLCDLI